MVQNTASLIKEYSRTNHRGQSRHTQQEAGYIAAFTSLYKVDQKSVAHSSGSIYIERVIRSVTFNDKQNCKVFPLSWIDYFLLGQIDIVGFSFDYSEFDLWWLLNERLRVIEILKKRLRESLNLKENQDPLSYLKFGSVTFYDTEILNIYDSNSKEDFSNQKKNESNLKSEVLKNFDCVYEYVQLSPNKTILSKNTIFITNCHNEEKNSTEDNNKINIKALEHNRAVYEKLIESIKPIDNKKLQGMI